MKRFTALAQDAWMKNNPGRSMTIYDIPEIVAKALPLAASLQPLPISVPHSVLLECFLSNEKSFRKMSTHHHIPPIDRSNNVAELNSH